MKIHYLFLIAGGLSLASCVDLDLNPLSQATNGNWNQTEQQIEMSVNDFYDINNWPEVYECWDDDQIDRSSVGDFASGRITSENKEVQSRWEAYYRVIGRVNAVLKKLEVLPAGTVSEDKMKLFLGECYFMRACMYSRLAFHFGDIPYSNTIIDIPTALSMGRTPKDEVLKYIYEDFDKAIDGRLPISYDTGFTRATLGAALGMKARVALWFKDWDTVIACTNRIINELKCYELYDDYYKLFLNSTHNTKESVFSLARSVSAGKAVTYWQDRVPRNNKGYARYVPTWDLLAAYLCTDGLPIDESPNFDPHKPFENRDPRCSATIVAFDDYFMGYQYNPNPETGKQVLTDDGKTVKNNDNLSGSSSASYNGLIWKKRVDKDCLANSFKTEHDMWIMRYADVLLMYAEAKIEKNDIDQTVLDAMNQVRARAYKCEVSATTVYPAITETDQTKLRSILRFERRMEFPMENLRYYDLIRWRICEKVFGEGMKNYGLPRSASSTINDIVKPGYWFWGETPEIDENGIVDFTKLAEKKMCNSLATRGFNSRQYLWPIPYKEIIINPNMTQNDGY